jgi:hypothetical protein
MGEKLYCASWEYNAGAGIAGHCGPVVLSHQLITRYRPLAVGGDWVWGEHNFYPPSGNRAWADDSSGEPMQQPRRSLQL